jgi:antitoxin (DNA-binding transcriptional repressor) of toxin-antitoxin stability system
VNVAIMENIPMKKVTRIAIDEFERNSDAVLDRAGAGEYFELERNGVVILTVSPVQQVQAQDTPNE